MAKFLYINTSGKESMFLHLGKKILDGKEVILTSPEEAMKYIEAEHPSLVIFDRKEYGESLEDTLSTVNFRRPVKSISFTTKGRRLNFF